MIARARHPATVLNEIGLAGTPEQLNWGYDLCVGGEEFEHLDVGVVRSSTRVNKALLPSYVGNLEAAFDAKTAQAFIEGEFVNLSRGQVYYGFNPAENEVKIPMPHGAQLGCGMDFNVDPMAFVVFWVHQGHMHVFKEYELPNSDTEYACQRLREEWGDRLLDIYPDPSCRQRHTNSPGGKTDADYIKRAGFAIHARPPGLPTRKDRYNAVNGKFKPGKGVPSLTVDPSCKKLCKYLTVYTHEQINTKDAKRMSHLLDAFSYPVELLFPVTREELKKVKLVGY